MRRVADFKSALSVPNDTPRDRPPSAKPRRTRRPTAFRQPPGGGRSIDTRRLPPARQEVPQPMTVTVRKSARLPRAAGVVACVLVAGLLPATGPAQTEIAAPLLRFSGPPQTWGVWYQPGSVFNPGASSPIAFFGPG